MMPTRALVNASASHHPHPDQEMVRLDNPVEERRTVRLTLSPRGDQ